jgi:hypothetical protein
MDERGQPPSTPISPGAGRAWRRSLLARREDRLPVGDLPSSGDSSTTAFGVKQPNAEVTTSPQVAREGSQVRFRQLRYQARERDRNPQRCHQHATGERS